ncbi:MAG: hypothetical protein H0X37_08295 [Herpetosiphonaceae bacterium]|nr:hypothetical protein [Herpetosiphonaceae bacterium]
MSKNPGKNAESGAEVYETSTPATRPTTMRETRTFTPSPTIEVERPMVMPTDRVRWGPIIAGLFAALSTLALLTVLGIALGASAFTPGDRASSFGLGAGIWGAISALLAFAVGGWTAARTAAAGTRNGGLINGTMVWVVAIPLLLYALSSGIGSILGTAGRVAGTTAQIVAPAAGQAANQAANSPGAQATAQAGAATAIAGVQQTAEAVRNAVADPNNQATAASGIKKAAWGALGTLLLSLAAAAGGGLAGSRRLRDDAQAV